MRIGLFSDTYLPDINGVVSSIETLRQKLVENGHECFVICTYPTTLFETKVTNENNIIRIPGLELKKLYGYALASPFHFSLIDDIKQLNLDLIHVHTEFGVGIFARIVAKKLNIPLVSTYHTTYEDYTHYVNILNSSLIEKGAKKVVAKLSKLYSDSCVRIIAPSLKTKKMLINYHISEDVIDVIPTGIDLARFDLKNIDTDKLQLLKKQYHIQDHTKVLVYIGRIAKEKSLDVVLQALAKVKDQLEDTILLIVGDGPYMSEIQKYAKELEIQKEVIFVGKVMPNEVAYYYHLGSFFISASTTETQGMTFIEALASGLKLIARKDEAILEIGDQKNTGYFFDDIDQLSSIFLNISQNNFQNKPQDKQYCVDLAMKYSADSFYQEVLNFYLQSLDDFYNQYTITGIKAKSNSIVLSLLAFNQNTLNITISLDDYLQYGFRKNNKISKSVLDKLLVSEEIAKCYDYCLKKLVSKDYSIRQMYDLIIKNFNLKIEDVNQIIEKLESKNLLNDKNYVNHKISYYRSLFFSKNKIKRLLMKDALNPKIIEEGLELYDFDYEFDEALKIANKLCSSIKDRSLKSKINYIKQHLYRKGFDQETIDGVVERLDFSQDEYYKMELIKKIAVKAKKQYHRIYKGRELRNKMFNYLYRQGFEADEIYVTLDEMEWEDDKD